MRDIVRLIIWMVVDLFRSRAAIEAEIWTLRQQMNVLRRTAPKKQTFSSIDRVPTISFRLLYGLLIMGQGRRHILWFGVTAHPTAEWIANQVTEACGWEQAPRYIIRDREGAYGEVVIRRPRSIGIRDRPSSPRSPWQNAYAERLIGSIRRECLDHVIVFGERHLRHLLLRCMKYYIGARTHLSLEKDAPVSRAVDRAGHILCRPVLGGLHHQYVRI